MKTITYYYYYLLTYFIKLKYQLIFEKDEFERDILRASLFALKTHHSVRQSYDKYPYFYHVNMVKEFAIKFGGNLSKSDLRLVILGALFHDLIEDCRLTYNDVKTVWGVEVADIVFACTELRGKNRNERHGPFYIKGLQKSRLGTYVKLCDINANMTQGTITGSSMLQKYRKDYPKTKENLYLEEFDHIFKYIETNLL